MLAKYAFKRGVTVVGLGCVISHSSSLVPGTGDSAGH
jgi:hypothetical protein